MEESGVFFNGVWNGLDSREYTWATDVYNRSDGMAINYDYAYSNPKENEEDEKEDLIQYGKGDCFT